MSKGHVDLAPLLLIPALALAALGAIGSPSTWLTLTFAGAAMGMIIFTIASGLTLVFGLMDVLNFGHGIFITLGAYIAVSAFGLLNGNFPPTASGDFAKIAAVMLVAMAFTAFAGLIFERLLIRPVYGQHLKQILITMGGLIIGEELVKVTWGVQPITLGLPLAVRGSWIIGDTSIEKYRALACLIGGAVFVAQVHMLNSTKIGLLVRAGVQDREMVQSLGYRISRLFIGVFVAGSALAGLGGVMWALYQQTVVPQIGAQVNVLIFIVIIIGGLGSTGGAMIGAILVGLLNNYVGFLAPKIALFCNIGLMVGILLWRPQGLYASANA